MDGAAPLDPVTRAMSQAVLAISSERTFEGVLQRIVDTGRELVGARYAAVGVPDGEGGFDHFVVSGMTEAQIEAIGPLPRQHGMLGAILHDRRSYRVRDIRRDPRFEGWPKSHPTMRDFLGVPIWWQGEAVGAFYLTEKVGADEFDEHDQQLVELLAPHAAVAIRNAELLGRVGELTVVEERNRLARELHDSVSQTLFSMSFTAEAAADLIERDPAQAAESVRRLGEQTRAALAELRELIFELRPPDVAAEGLAPALEKHVALVCRAYRCDVQVLACDVDGLATDRASELFRIAQEALSNALRHAGAARITIDVRRRDGDVVLEVTDDGRGFDPEAAAVRARHLGLTSMEERSRALGGTLTIDSAPGRGTTVRAEVPVG